MNLTVRELNQADRILPSLAQLIALTGTNRLPALFKDYPSKTRAVFRLLVVHHIGSFAQRKVCHRQTLRNCLKMVI